MYLNYQVDLSLRKRHLFHVTLQIPAHAQQALNISLPAWIPGSYMIRDFAKHIISIKARSAQNGASLPLRKQDKQHWILESKGQACTLIYQVYAFDSSVRTAYLDDNRAFFNGTSLFLQIEELAHCPHQLDLRCPDEQSHWRVATGLCRADGTSKYAFGLYLATNYAELIDCPVEIGQFDALEFEVLGIPHHLILTGKHYADSARLMRDLTKLCELHIRMFDPNNVKAPFSEYWFLTNILPDGFGGLEHRNSTALLCSNFDFPNQQRPNEMTDGYKTFLSLASHEYFHAWNVCRIKPQELIAPTLGQENHTSQLWAFEGITSYYDDLSLYRSGLISFSDYLTLLSKTLTRVQRGKGELKQSVADSSFDSWTRFYQQGEDAVNNIVSYYTKGAMVALWMDLTIRLQSQGKHSLDDLMRALWSQFGQTGQGTTEQDFITLLNTFCGHDQSTAFTKILHSSERLSLDELLAQVGVDVRRHAPRANDLLAAETKDSSPYLGIQYRAHTLGLEVQMVLEDSPAEQAGVCAKDILIALDGVKLDGANLLCLLQNQAIGQPFSVHLFRNQQLHALKLTPSHAPEYVVELSEQNSELCGKWQKVIGQ
ncbi:M61 family metallopeptidase [Bowmanella pacifica]|uniref:Peptidase M61 n=2 Tax=Bowmanella TaxID=366580 RepID=A0A917YYC2_9ALTE|nr:PDZ domain-containing protein [Bowmanella pacifica]GGO70371.1 peptidase M61 [Bowmanella pacifica]